MSIRILLIDDHALFLNGMELMLRTNKGLEVAGMCYNGQEAMDFLKNTKVDLVLLDINMPVLNGYETCMQIKELYPDIQMIAISMLIEHNTIRKMLHAGVRGFVYKNADAELLFEAINAVVQQQYYLEPDAEYILKEFLLEKKNEEKGYFKYQKFELTQREKEILKMIVEGYTNVEIADKIFLSSRTIETHRKNILSKLQLKNTASLVKYATENRVFLGID